MQIPTLAQVLEAGHDAEDYDLENVGLLSARRLEGSRDDPLTINTLGGEINTGDGQVNCGSVATSPDGSVSTGSIDVQDIQLGDSGFGRATYIDPATATPADVIQAMLDAGLMQPPA